MAEPTSLRDQFAMAALPVCAGGIVQPDQRDRQRLARAAFALADEMLRAREIDPDQLALLR
jgi:hypothetical protein